MKQLFRRDKPPLRILEKGDMRPKTKRKKVISVYKKQEVAIPKPEVFVVLERKPAPDIKHGQPVKVNTGDHAGEIAVVIGPSKTLPGRLGVLTLGGLVHYKPEDLEVQK